jgi:hypothetical protein
MRWPCDPDRNPFFRYENGVFLRAVRTLNLNEEVSNSAFKGRFEIRNGKGRAEDAY